MDCWGFPKERKWDYYQKIGTHNTMHHKQTSAAEVAVLDMKIGVNMGEVKKVAVALLAIQEATELLVLVVYLAVVVPLETETNILMVEMER